MPSSARIAIVAVAFPLTLAVTPIRAAGQAVDYRARLDSLFEILESHQRTMGAVTIRKGDRVLYQRTFGWRDSSAAGWVRSDGQTGFRVGSVTKPFTAVMIYQLIDERRLSLDTRLSRFFPQLPNSRSITIRDLLGHTSGLADYSRGLDVFVPLSRDSLLRRIAMPSMQFPPGTERRYNNSNYLLLGYIAESLTESSYATQLERRIVKPIGLRRTHVGGPVAASNEARAYFFSDGHWEEQRDDAIENAGGAGSLVSTSDDLTRFLAALFGGRLISHTSVAEMTTGFTDGVRKNGKGLSPFTIPGQGKSGYSHDGSIGAHTALIGYVPADSLALALTINGHNYPQNRIFFQVWGILYGTAEPLPAFAPVAMADSTATPLVGVYAAAAYGLTITIRRNGDALEAQAEGQDPFRLTYVGKNRFIHVPAGILLEFADPVNGVSPRFTLFQQKAAIPLTRAP